jgi:hypothetical protein
LALGQTSSRSCRAHRKHENWQALPLLGKISKTESVEEHGDLMVLAASLLIKIGTLVTTPPSIRAYNLIETPLGTPKSTADSLYGASLGEKHWLTC